MILACYILKKLDMKILQVCPPHLSDYYYYYYYYAAVNAPCVGHKDDESQAM